MKNRKRSKENRCNKNSKMADLVIITFPVNGLKGP